MHFSKPAFLSLFILGLSLLAFPEDQASPSLEWSWHGVSSQSQDATNVGINWLYGNDTSIDGVQLNMLFGYSVQNTKGWQSALLFNVTSGVMSGFQSSFFYNSAKEFSGLSLAVIGLNRSELAVRGVQIGLIGNISGRDISVGQIGCVNLANGKAGAGQIGLYSLNRGFDGIQLDLLASTSLGKGVGLQFAPLAWGNEIIGAQLGAVSYAKKLQGLQLGIINIADEISGVQVGIINISNKMDGMAIGLIDIHRNGENNFSYTCETTFTHPLEQQYHTIAYRFGSRYLYKSLSFGFRTGKHVDLLPLYSASLQLGARVPVIKNSLAIMADAGIAICNWQQAIEIDYEETIQDRLVPEAKEMLELKLGKRFGLFGGFKQRFYCDVWNDQYIPDTAFKLVVTPDGNLFVHNSLLIGVEY